MPSQHLQVIPAATITLDWSDHIWPDDQRAGHAHRTAVRRSAAGLGMELLEWAQQECLRHGDGCSTSIASPTISGCGDTTKLLALFTVVMPWLAGRRVNEISAQPRERLVVSPIPTLDCLRAWLWTTR